MAGVVVAVAGLLALSLGVYSLEAVYARRKLRRYLGVKGWRLVRARWRPLLISRSVRFAVDAARGDESVTGQCFVGSSAGGPFFSSAIELVWERERGQPDGPH